MNFREHLELKGKHATFSPSSPYWVGESFDELQERRLAGWMPTIGTVTHSFAETAIREREKLNKYDKKAYKLYLLDNKETCIPRHIVDILDIDYLYSNLMQYVNDGIGYKMKPEQRLVYSEYFWGTADCISFRNNTLRIHDLKTGRSKVKMLQLEVYAALFCLEYGYKPGDINIILRIYQDSEIIEHVPEVDAIVPIMDQIVVESKNFTNFTEGDDENNAGYRRRY